MIFFYEKDLITIKTVLPKLALLGATLVWGASFVIMKGTLDNVPVFTLLALRFTGAFVFMSLIFCKKWKKINKKTLWQGSVLGIILFVAYAVQTTGLKFSTPGKNAFLTAIYCVLVPFMFWFITKEKPDKYNIVSAFICIAGVGLVSLTSQFTIETGDALSLLGGVMYAVHIIFIALYTKDGDPVMLSTIQFLSAGICAWTASLIFEDFPSTWTTDMLAEIIYLAVLCTAIAFILQMWGQKYEAPASASLILSLESVFGVIFSVILGDEKLSIQLISGFSLIFAAIIISQTKLSFINKLSTDNKKHK